MMKRKETLVERKNKSLVVASLVEREKESLVMERKWSLVEENKGKKIGKQRCHLRRERCNHTKPKLIKKIVSTQPKNLQGGSGKDDLIGKTFYLWRKPKFWRWRRAEK